MEIDKRVQRLRSLMKERGIDAYIVPSSDAHQSEYVCEYWKCREWISGFTGSAGTIVVTQHSAGLWTDGRYYIQAEKQLKESRIKLFKMGEAGVLSYLDWIKETLPEGSCIGFDGTVFSAAVMKNMENMYDKKNIKFEYSFDLIGELWENRPQIPSNSIFTHDVKYAGKSRNEKLAEVRKEMKNKNANYYLLSSLDDIAWLYNIRGNDVPNNPVVISYAVVSDANSWLFIEHSKVDDNIRQELQMDGIEIKEYYDIEEFVKSISDSDKLLLDPNKTNVRLYKGINSKTVKIEDLNVTTNLKAVKNDMEIDSLIKCQTRDGAAVVKFLYWLDKSIGKETITEITVDRKLQELRKDGELFIGPSFDTIAGYKDHAAMMHYKATCENRYVLEKEGFLLVDSGGQYLDGTTDITRTIAMGKLSEEEVRDFTLVLKGHIGLCTAKFLYGCTGANLDILARKPIWEYGMDYKCGTGHGVGFLLNVHEGPHGFGQGANSVKLEKGMVVTNEPGIYKEGKYGIRTENTMLVVEDEKTDAGQFMKFKVISYCPIDLNAVNINMLAENEKDWLNNYHQEVYKRLSPYLNGEETKWLEEKTRCI